jgi:hypothetical protein
LGAMVRVCLCRAWSRVAAFDAVVRPWCDLESAWSVPPPLKRKDAHADETDHARRVQVVELRRRPLSRARGNRDKPHLCAGFTLK